MNLIYWWILVRSLHCIKDNMMKTGMNAILWSSLRNCLSIFSKALLVIFLCGRVLIRGGHCCGKSYFFFNAFTRTSGQKRSWKQETNRLGSKWNTRTEKSEYGDKRKKIIIGKITLQEPAVTVLVLTSIMLFPVLKCYSLFKCLSKRSTIRCTQTVPSHL